MSNNSERLVGLSDGELEALAESMLAPAAQARLDELLARSKEHSLSVADNGEFDRLLERVDQLTILKTRARYTLSQRAAASET
jgi:IS5 family transposase